MSIFPFINPEAFQSATASELPLFKEYAYDFDNKCLKLKDGKTYLVEGNDALRIWIHFALLTARYRYTAHSRDYGSELDTLMGRNMSDEIVQTEVERFITEALMVNPYIKELYDFTFESTGDGLKVEFNVKTVYGEENVEWEMKGVAV